MKKYVLILAFVLADTAAFCMGSGPGSTGNNFLKISPDARSAAMADAFAAVSEGSYGLYYNPAGLSSIFGCEAQLTHINWFQGMNYEYAAFVAPDLLDWGKIGLAFSYFTAGTMQKTQDLPQYDYAYLNRDPNLASYTGGSYNPYSYSAVLGYSFQPLGRFSFGFKFKYTGNQLDAYKDSNMAAGLGVLYNIPWGDNYLRLGALLDNVGTRISLGSSPADQPMNLSLGVSDRMLVSGWNMLIAAQTIMQWDNTAVFSISGEYWLFNCMALRAGLKTADYMQPTFGAGYRFKNLEFDYAYASFDNLGATHRFTLLATWGTPKARLNVYPQKISPNNDGFLDRMFFMPVLMDEDMVENVKINIYGMDGGAPLVSIPVNAAKMKKIEWDGRREGKPLPDGIYKAAVEAQYSLNGSSESDRVDIEIDNTPPEVGVEAGPEINDKENHGAILIPATFTFFARDKNNIDRWQLVIWDSKKKIFFSTGAKGLPPISYTWDGKRGSGGSYVKKGKIYYYSFFAWDTLNNKAYTAPAAKPFLNQDVKLIFSSDALFESGHAGVKVSAYQTIKKMKKIIKKYPASKILITGHTDNVPPAKGDRDNFQLSKARADAVKFYLVNMMGIKEDRIETEGDGDMYPVASNGTARGREKNRRVEIIIRNTVYK